MQTLLSNEELASEATHLLPVDLQLSNEYQFSRKHINKYLRQFINSEPELVQAIDYGVSLLEEWLQKEHSEEKQLRLAAIKPLNLHQLVTDIIVSSLSLQEPELFVSFTAKLAIKLNFADHKEAIHTIAEIVVVLAGINLYDITKKSLRSSLIVVNRVKLPKALYQAIERSQYLPPMVCEPNELVSNYESAYLSHNDCLILGKNNGHDGNICLDVINTQNKIPLSLNVKFLSTVEEDPTSELDTFEKQRLWKAFKAQSYNMYSMLMRQGNRFFLTNKVDKRGRLYTQGYHVTSQGSAFKKAMIDLNHKELVEGAPK